MANLMYAEMGLNLISGIGQYMIGKESAKLDESIRKYRERMSAISAALNKNAITHNEIALTEGNVFARASIQSAEMQDIADFEVEAAAAGVMGNTIDVGVRQLKGDAARAQTARERRFRQEMQAQGQQRLNVEMQQIMGRDVTPISRPNLGAAVFGMLGSAVETWDAHNPSDRRISTRLSRG